MKPYCWLIHPNTEIVYCWVNHMNGEVCWKEHMGCNGVLDFGTTPISQGNFGDWKQKHIPIGSMYAIYGNIYHQYTPNVSIHTIHGSYGIGKWTWENHGKSGKSWEDDCRKYMEIWKCSSYPLVHCPITMERSTILNGKTHYFYGHFQQLCQSLPEGAQIWVCLRIGHPKSSAVLVSYDFRHLGNIPPVISTHNSNRKCSVAMLNVKLP